MYYHIVVEVKNKTSKNDSGIISGLDLTNYEDLINQYVIPYFSNKDFYVHGKEINKKDIAYIRISKTDKTASQLSTEINRNNYAEGVFITYTNEDAVISSQYDITTNVLKEPKERLNPEEVFNYSVSIASTIHPKIKDVSLRKIGNEHYADAVESAFKEINSRLKKIYNHQKDIEKDGRDLMAQIFSDSNPVLKLYNDIDSFNGKNEQEGYRFIFMGSMVAIRNPKAHENQTISKEDAFDRLIFASLLMKKINQALLHSYITE
ncbi:MAG: TIGR02391 family protein [Tenericutes bacterium]|nr:TIGR02391 family protein [Mycoplasmatota bacterium]